MDTNTSCNAFANVPVIALEPFAQVSEYAEHERARVLQQVLDASMDSGFMNIVGHGIPETLISSCLEAAGSFFEQNLDVKLQSAGAARTSIGYSVRGEKSYKADSSKIDNRHFKEIFDIGPSVALSNSLFPANIFPAYPRDFQCLMEAYYTEMERIEKILYRIFSLALGQTAGIYLSGDFLERAKGNHHGLLRLNYYPMCHFIPASGDLRDGAHTDWTSFTILFTEKEGLEVLTDEQWRLVPLIPEALTVNIGNQLHWWSNGLFKPSVHRVNANHCRESSRLSFAFFSTEVPDPTDEAMIHPICAPGVAPLFQPVSIKDYLLDKFERIKD